MRTPKDPGAGRVARAGRAGSTPLAVRLVVAGLAAVLCAFGAAPTFAAEEAPAHGAEVAHAHGQAAHGEEAPSEEAPSIDGRKLGLQILNFTVLVGILVFFGGKAVNKTLRARHEQLKSDLASASELRKAAEAKLARQEARLGSLESEIAELRRNLKAEAESEKARLVATAEERAARIKTETAFLIDQQVHEASLRLRRESADAALTIAEDILRRSIGAADQRRLLETFVGDVERPIAPGPADGGRVS